MPGIWGNLASRLGKLLKALRQGRQQVRSGPAPVGQAPDDSPTAREEYLWFGRELEAVSSNVQSYRYDADTNTLFVRFIGHGSLYKYHPVYAQEAEDFALSVSKGQQVWKMRREKRPYEFVESSDGHVPKREAPDSQKPGALFRTGIKITERTHRLAREKAKFKARQSRQR